MNSPLLPRLSVTKDDVRLGSHKKCGYFLSWLFSHFFRDVRFCSALSTVKGRITKFICSQCAHQVWVQLAEDQIVLHSGCKVVDDGVIFHEIGPQTMRMCVPSKAMCQWSISKHGIDCLPGLSLAERCISEAIALCVHSSTRI